MTSLVCLAILLALAQCEPLQWTAYPLPAGAVSPPLRREAMAEYDSQHDQVILFGGRNIDQTETTIEVFADTWALDLNNMTWRILPTSVNPPPTYSGVAGIIQGKYFVIATGGLEGDEQTNAVWVLPLGATVEGSAEELTWHQLTVGGDVPDARYGAVGSIVGTDLYLSHGASGTSYADSYRLDLRPLVNTGINTDALAWQHVGGGSTEYSPEHPHPRTFAAGTVTPTRNLVMYGGCLSSNGHAGPCPSRDAWVYTIQLDKWRWAAEGPEQSKFGGLANIKDNEVLLWGGEHRSEQIVTTDEPQPDIVHVLNPATLRWRRYNVSAFDNDESNIPEIRAGHVFVSIGAARETKVLMWGGDGGYESTSQNIYILSGELAHTEPLELGWFVWTLWHIHGLFMFFAWGVVFQISACIARYGKKAGGSMWLWGHGACNLFGIVLAITGTTLGFVSATAVSLEAGWAHSVIGILVMIAMALQPIIGIFRPSKESDKRSCWSWTHKIIGWVLLVLTFVNIFLGLLVALLNSIAWAFLAYAGVIIIMHIILSLLGFSKEEETKPDYTPMDNGHFKTSEVFQPGTKGGSSALYK
eukprot:TRINITY_DN17279_c0_g1_i1.p1 TRINITY_DN17279_c0_g1~~TRINITY_DN17279_c0_g1_i1.p1  ORF type:complete len:585 (+),score=109.25 TRINITY_DN17279_c0_g1_i1:3-1757(+)